ncbi:MAG TPA: twin-arginine translocation signal domain-containing protein [Blastocatellia bacterium]|jgi:hypothetical protein|nr:twin-arginine translocation signal domain-containing protein [Blastocatellia bacterium]
MAISRRKFLKAGAAVSLAGAIPFKVNAQQSRRGVIGSDSDSADLSFPTKAQFSEFLNTTFWISLGTANTLEVELIDVNELKHSSAAMEPAKAKRERFSLIFRGPKDKPLKQDSYTMKHHNLGTLLIFLVPMGSDKKGTGLRYEAVVSRLAS